MPVLAVLLTFVVFGKVLSPQFLIWLLPVAALLAPRRPLLAGIFIGIVALTQVEFPSLFRALVALRPEAISVVALRNTGIVALWVLVLVDLWRLPRVADAGRRSRRWRRQGCRIASIVTDEPCPVAPSAVVATSATTPSGTASTTAAAD